jgi:NAD(P)-dependent dehydrogenase (short-subunit alcohol dehydrogenase family)
MSAYSASKAGIIMLARSLALDLSERGIRVNAIAPGLVDTPMPRNFLKNLANKDQLWASMLEKSPLKRAATPEEIVGLAVYLAGDESSYTTGAVIPVDGGRTAT